jgi:hypothetical protein
MFAKLVTNPNTAVYSNTFFNTLVGVITGSITSNNQLDGATFNKNASQIITTVPSGWIVHDPQANLVARTYNVPGSPPVVISSPWSDNGSYSKYLWLTQNAGGNTLTYNPLTTPNPYFWNILAVPMEFWSNTTKVAVNSYISQATMNTVQINIANYSSNATMVATNFRMERNNSDFIGPMDFDITTTGTTTIISSSNTHLFVGSYKGIVNPVFNSYFFLSEYTRDDAWSIAANGYPSWYFELGSNTTGLYDARIPGSLISSSHAGSLARIYNTRAEVDHSWVDMLDYGTRETNIGGGANSNWGVASRFIPWAFTSNTISGYINRPYTPRGLALAGQASMFIGNQNTYRDINKNITYGLAEIKLQPIHAGTILNSNNIFLGGSISAKTPYIYLFKSQWNNLDETSFGGDVWMNLILNVSGPGTTNASCILIKEV